MLGFKKTLSHPVLALTLLVIAVIFLLGTYLFATNRSKFVSQPTNNQSKIVLGKSYEGWTEYVNDDFGLNLYYPPQFKNYGYGSLSTTSQPGNTGTEICINLDGCLRDKESYFEIRATSVGWSGTQQFRFTDIQGYRQSNGIYFARLPSGREAEILTALVEEVKSNSGVEILLVKGTGGSQANKGYPDEGWIGALINKDLPIYKGVAIQMKFTPDLDGVVFRKILATIDFPQETNPADENQVLNEPVPSKFMDGIMRYDMAKVAEIVNCRFQIDKQYPKSYYPDQKCGTAGTMKNSNTGKPYYYSPTNNDQGFVIKAKLSTGEIYTITEETHPPR